MAGLIGGNEVVIDVVDEDGDEWIVNYFEAIFVFCRCFFRKGGLLNSEMSVWNLEMTS